MNVSRDPIGASSASWRGTSPDPHPPDWSPSPGAAGYLGVQFLNESLLKNKHRFISRGTSIPWSKAGHIELTLIREEFMTRLPGMEERLRRIPKQCNQFSKVRSAAIPLMLRVDSRKQMTTFKKIPDLQVGKTLVSA